MTSVDIDRRKVVLDGGKDQVSFDKLIIAPGGTPKRLPIPGADLENVITFRTVADATKVDAAAKEGKNLVVIGSSFISMEIVAAVAKRGLASIHVIGMEEFPFQAVLGKEVGKGLMAVSTSEASVIVYSCSFSIMRRMESSSTCRRRSRRSFPAKARTRT